MTKKLADFGFSSPKLLLENVCESGHQNLRQKCINHESFKNLLPSWHIFGKIRCKIPFLFKIKTMDEYD